jgi:GntR family transcriptional regulator
MLIRINPKDGLPVYQQIMQQIKHLIASGSLAPGEQLPPARELAVQLLVNAHTVSKAYTELEWEGIVERRRGSGTYVAEGGRNLTAQQRADLLAPLVERLVVEAVQLGLSLDEVQAAVGRQWDALAAQESAAA